MAVAPNMTQATRPMTQPSLEQAYGRPRMPVPMISPTMMSADMGHDERATPSS